MRYCCQGDGSFSFKTCELFFLYAFTKRPMLPAACICLVWYSSEKHFMNKSWKELPTKQLLYGHLLSISQIIQVRRTRHTRHCYRSKDKLINILLWTPTHGRTIVGWSARTQIHQLCVNTGCSLDLLGAMDDRDE